MLSFDPRYILVSWFRSYATLIKVNCKHAERGGQGRGKKISGFGVSAPDWHLPVSAEGRPGVSLSASDAASALQKPVLGQPEELALVPAGLAVVLLCRAVRRPCLPGPGSAAPVPGDGRCPLGSSSSALGTPPRGVCLRPKPIPTVYCCYRRFIRQQL